MALKLKKMTTLTITNDDEVFSDSSYADVKFAVDVKPLTRNILQKLTKECTKVTKSGDEIDNDKLSFKIFDYIYISSDIIIEDEDGIVLEDGTNAYKKELYSNYLELASCITAAAMKFEEKCRVEDATLKK